MKIKSVSIKNFRGYKNLTTINFGNLIAIVGKNDIGKSTILEALDIYFNEGKGVVKLDKEDINKSALADGDNEIIISVVFEDLPTSIVIDSTNETTLINEYLLNVDGCLEIIKKYPNAGKEKVFVKANHPTNLQCKDLLLKKDSDLRLIIKDLNIECNDRNKNAVMRASIWNHFQTDLNLEEIEIDVTKGDTKSIWDKLQCYLPLYSLFQSDRKNSDGDSEVQDPLKEAVKQILNNEDIQRKFNEIATEVEDKLRDVSNRTLEKLREMNPEVANSLNPVIPSNENLKWADVFKNVSISGDENIPINKRGSGVKRLILLNFFRAEAERRKTEENFESIIYAIEEPETSQHNRHQKQLIKAFKELSNSPNTQIILTTHSPIVVKELEFEQLKMVIDENFQKRIVDVDLSQLPYPSFNEVNYIAFNEVSEEYHNELYGYIESEEKLNDYKSGKMTLLYNKQNRNGDNIEQDIILTEYIRHQIHHPENTLNTRYTIDQLESSIAQMRDFIKINMQVLL